MEADPDPDAPGWLSYPDYTVKALGAPALADDPIECRAYAPATGYTLYPVVRCLLPWWPVDLVCLTVEGVLPTDGPNKSQLGGTQ